MESISLLYQLEGVHLTRLLWRVSKCQIQEVGSPEVELCEIEKSLAFQTSAC